MRLVAMLAKIGLALTLVGIFLSACSTGGNATKPSKPSTLFHTTLKTSDGALQLQFSMTPNRFGKNMFVVDVQRTSNGKPVINEQAQIFTTMLDMDMGTGVIFLQPNGSGRYSASGLLSMDGNWDIHIQLLDAADTAVHVAKFKVYIPA